MSTAGAVGLAENLKGNEIQLWRFVTSFLEKSLAMPAMSPSVLWKTENFGGTIAKISCQAKASCLEWAEEREKPGVAAQKQVEDGIWQSPATNRPLPGLSDGPRSAYRKQPLPLGFPTCRTPPGNLTEEDNSGWLKPRIFFFNFVSLNKKEQYEERMSSYIYETYMHREMSQLKVLRGKLKAGPESHNKPRCTSKHQLSFWTRTLWPTVQPSMFRNIHNGWLCLT